MIDIFALKSSSMPCVRRHKPRTSAIRERPQLHVLTLRPRSISRLWATARLHRGTRMIDAHLHLWVSIRTIVRLGLKIDFQCFRTRDKRRGESSLCSVAKGIGRTRYILPIAALGVLLWRRGVLWRRDNLFPWVHGGALQTGACGGILGNGKIGDV